jgi:hypothetical protein
MSDGNDALLHEIAEDMLDVMRRLSAIERVTQESARSIETLRQELLGERRGLNPRTRARRRGA